MKPNGMLGNVRTGIRSGLEAIGEFAQQLLRKYPVLYTLYSILSWILLAGFLASLFYMKESRTMLLQYGWSLYVLLQFWFLCRSKTLTWRTCSYFFLAGAWLTVPINTVIVNAITALFGGEARDIWSTAIVTPIMEEMMKLLPLGVFLFLSRRASTLSLADYALIGGATGAGFQWMEETVRRFVSGMFPYGMTLFDGQVLHWELYDWFPGYFESSFLPDKMSSGHAVLTALIALGAGFAIRFRKRLTYAVFLFPLFLLLWAILDHAVWNGDYQTPGWLERIHEWLGSGYRAEPLLLLMIAAAVLIDYIQLNKLKNQLPALQYEPVINPVSELLLLTWMLFKDRRQFGYLLYFYRERRELGMALLHGNAEGKARLPLLNERVYSIHGAMTIAAVALLFIIGLTAVSGWTPDGSHDTCFACLFDNLQSWWDRRSGWEKAAIIAGAFALSFPFMGVWSAIGAVSFGYGIVASGHQVADIIRHPGRLKSPEYAAAALFTLGLNRLPFGRIAAARMLPSAKGLARYEITTKAGLTYRTTLGSRGQIISVFAKIEPRHIDTGTITNDASRRFARMLGRRTDDAGHAIGNKLGGLGSRKSGNIFPQNPTVNRGAFREFEKMIAEEVLAGKDVFVRVTPKYPPGSTRPSEVLYQVRIDGETISKIFRNP
ncbi:PrsW family glutamic-type intramembrane protease [Paenibacillus cisolokensis]|uniref:PrsW family glutamic-type intramembrane protease n=1 Tax=Paenibacillus cisolokensis TaxID=1658519 RepID=UPI003D2B7DA2